MCLSLSLGLSPPLCALGGDGSRLLKDFRGNLGQAKPGGVLQCSGCLAGHQGAVLSHGFGARLGEQVLDTLPWRGGLGPEELRGPECHGMEMSQVGVRRGPGEKPGVFAPAQVFLPPAQVSFAPNEMFLPPNQVCFPLTRCVCPLPRWFYSLPKWRYPQPGDFALCPGVFAR